MKFIKKINKQILLTIILIITLIILYLFITDFKIEKQKGSGIFEKIKEYESEILIDKEIKKNILSH